jgi:hypothetical protein
MAIRSGWRVLAAIGLAFVACKKSAAPSADATTDGGTTMVDPSTTSTGGSTSGDDVVDPTNDTNPGGTNCCELHDGIGCDEAAVQACVCDEAPECCTFGWDDLCVDRALACDATCMPDPDPTTVDPTTTGTDPSDTSITDPDTGPVETGATNDGPCCEVAQSGTGCEDAGVTECVCDLDPYCCEEFWDEYCVAGASQSCGIECGNDCCMVHDAVACNDVEVFGCVVEQDRSCYGTWSQTCVNTAQGACGLMCG